jgi:hypothetical protein
VGADIACFPAIGGALFALGQLSISGLSLSALGSDHVTLVVDSFTPPEMTSLRI